MKKIKENLTDTHVRSAKLQACIYWLAFQNTFKETMSSKSKKFNLDISTIIYNGVPQSRWGNDDFWSEQKKIYIWPDDHFIREVRLHVKSYCDCEVSVSFFIGSDVNLAYPESRDLLYQLLYDAVQRKNEGLLKP